MHKAVLVALLVGLFVGRLLFPSSDDTYHTKVVHVTDRVPGPVVTNNIISAPDSCMKVIKTAQAFLRAGKQYELTISGLEAILSDTRKAAVMGSPQMANDVQDKLNELEPKTIGAAEVLGGNLTPYYRAVKRCQEAHHE
jgi:hypothetical protein